MSKEVAPSLSASISAHDWNERMRDAVMAITGEIPEVGAVVSFIIGIFWPTNEIDIFETLKKDIEILIDKKILEYELNERENEFNGLRNAIQEYGEAKLHEKAGLLTRWIGKADDLSVNIRKSKNDVHLILLGVTVAMLHLAGLRERFDHGKKLYGEDNTGIWQKKLEDMYGTYSLEYFPDIFGRWKSWRSDQVEITSWVQYTPVWPDTYEKVKDTVSGEMIQYCRKNHDGVGCYDQIANGQKVRMVNEASTKMVVCISPAISYNRFLPGKEKDPSVWHNVFNKMYLGPFSQDHSYKNSNDGRDSSSLRQASTEWDDYRDDSGPITKLIIREWNSIDAMQFIYANRSGNTAGDSNGGQEHVIEVGDKILSGFRMGFSNGVLTYVQILYSDGTKSDTFGNRDGWSCDELIAQCPDRFKINSWSCRELSGPSKTYGPGVLQFQYEPIASQAA